MTWQSFEVIALFRTLMVYYSLISVNARSAWFCLTVRAGWFRSHSFKERSTWWNNRQCKIAILVGLRLVEGFKNSFKQICTAFYWEEPDKNFQCFFLDLELYETHTSYEIIFIHFPNTMNFYRMYCFQAIVRFRFKVDIKEK